MSPFNQFSREERALYNPAFTALLVSRAVQGHESQYNQPCPIVVAVLSSVMALQPSVRRALPKRLNSGLIRWLDSSKGVKIAMSQNTTALAAVVRPGLLLALQREILHCNEAGKLTVAQGQLPRTISGATDEFRAIQKAAHMLGRWLPSAGNLSTVLTLLGVRP